MDMKPSRFTEEQIIGHSPRGRASMQRSFGQKVCDENCRSLSAEQRERVGKERGYL